MKLELQHLAGYLPYELWGLIFYTKTDFEKTKLCITDGLNNEADIASWLLGTYRVKPILHPLSDLIKEIEVNGEKFIPIEWLLENREVDSEYDFIVALENDWACAEDKIIFAPLSIALKLYEWHFDIHNLIENNLAIDKNTII
jgi:hypothetical protein